ncbi:kinase-like domain-containing protein [Mycena crocata]|nr:kinase-like domain-containing protein [Mycena crocata]
MDEPCSLVVARFLPVSSAERTWPLALDTVTKELPATRSFLAFRFGVETTSTEQDLMHNLFVIAPQGCPPPEGYTSFPLLPAPLHDPGGLTVTSPLPFPQPLCLHTFSMIARLPRLPADQKQEDCCLDAVSRERFIARWGTERMFRRAQSTWTGPEGAHEGPLIFEFLPLSHLQDLTPSVYTELDTYRRLVCDFSWPRAAHCIREITYARSFPTNYILQHPPTTLRCSPPVRTTSRHHLQLLALADVPSSSQSTWDSEAAQYTGTTDGASAYKPAPTTVAVAFSGLRVIVFDTRDTLLDFSASLDKALLVLDPDGVDTASFLERLAQKSLATPFLAASGILRECVGELAPELGLNPEDVDVPALVDLALSPEVREGALTLLQSLQASGLHVCQLPDVYPPSSFIALEVADVPAMTLCGQATNLDEVFQWARRRFDASLQRSQVLIVTASHHRVVEVANRPCSAGEGGFPTAVVAYGLETDAELSNSPTVAVQDLVHLQNALSNPLTPARPAASGALRFAGLYESCFELGRGAYGLVWCARHLLTGRAVAVKVGEISLRYEAQIYRCLGSHPNICPFLGLSSAGDLVLDMLGPTLDHLRRFCKGRLSLATTCRLGLSMIDALAHAHSCGIILRDLTPSNFAIGRGSHANRVFLFDLGLAKLVMDPRTGLHNPFKSGQPHIGTPRFASHDAHLGHEQSMASDAESLGFCLLYLHQGRLPWQGVVTRTLEEKSRIVGTMKQDFEPHSAPFSQWFDHCRRIEFGSRVDFSYLSQLLRAYVADEPFDWLKSGDGTIMPHEGAPSV